ncbi:MAG: Clp1/GlmU family protein [Candidatus Hodarchaeales archaeon]|jgi:polynucleotide 5'-hydroxyl-kinase GRC3/NOL9
MTDPERKGAPADCLQFDLQPGFCIYLRGPGHLIVTAGTANLFGFDLGVSKGIHLHQQAIYPVETSDGASVKYITLISGHAVHRGPGIPQNWKETAQKIPKEPFGQKILVIGAVDCGKSSLITYLANTLLKKHGEPIAIIDTDVGQSKIGPPGTLGLGLVSEQFVHLEEIHYESIYFVGDKSPRGNLLPIVLGLNSLIHTAQAKHSQAILIDTSGFVHGPAASTLKLAKIELVKPHWILALQRKDEIEHLLAVSQSVSEISRCEVPQRLMPLSRENRIARRMRAWQSLSFPSCHNFSMETHGLLGSPFNSLESDDTALFKQLEELLGPCFVSRSFESSDRISVLFKGEFPINDIRPIAEQYQSVIAGFPLRFFLHHYVGLLNESFETIGLGFIRDILFSKRTIAIETTMPENSLEAIKMVKLGRLRVDKTGRELSTCRPFLVDPIA